MRARIIKQKLKKKHTHEHWNEIAHIIYIISRRSNFHPTAALCVIMIVCSYDDDDDDDFRCACTLQDSIHC